MSRREGVHLGGQAVLGLSRRLTPAAVRSELPGMPYRQRMESRGQFYQVAPEPISASWRARHGDVRFMPSRRCQRYLHGTEYSLLGLSSGRLSKGGESESRSEQYADYL